MSLTGVLPVVPTPFLDGEIDYASFERMLGFFLPHADGYVLAGSTGEAPSLSLCERRELAEFALARTPHDKAVVVGIGHTEIRGAIELARHAESLGARACLVPSPYYFANTKRGVCEYLRALDREVGGPLVFYDNPYTTKTSWSASEIAALADEVGHLTGVKVTDHEIGKIAWLKANTNLAVYCGDDVVLYRSLLLGADGCMVIAPAVCPEAFRRSWDLLKEGEERESYEVFCRGVLPFVHMFGVGSEIAATKAIYRHLGVFGSQEVRPPLEPSSPEWTRQLVLAYETCQRL